MKTKTVLLMVMILVVCVAGLTHAAPMGTAFTYQGWLMNTTNNKPADGLHDFEFSLFAEPSDANQIGGTISKDNVDVKNGFFAVSLDFGDDPNVFNGEARWLEIAVRPDGIGSFDTLSPRQEATPTPYALLSKSVYVPLDVASSTNEPTIKVVNNGMGPGVQAENPATGILAKLGARLFGVSAYVTGPTSRGVIAEHSTSHNWAYLASQGTAVYGYSEGGYAGMFDGRLWVDGNVGIGTSNPQANLHVDGEVILQNGTAINEFSIDGTLGGNSDDAVPTEKAVKTYVDSQIYGGGFGVAPVGGVVAWLKSFPNTPSLSSDFVECNGQTLSDPESVYNGQTIPNLNGSGSTKRFLRGSTNSGAIGGSETHTHSIATNTQGENRDGAFNNNAAWKEHNHGGATGSQSTLPSYYEIVWIMRVK